MDKRYIALVPPCMLAPGLQVSKGITPQQWRGQCLQLFLQYGVDIMPFICIESSFRGYENGLRRKPHGIDYYCSLEGYKEYCRFLAEEMFKQICAMEEGGYQFVLVIGIEHSPSCAINYLYSHSGMQKRSGMFMTALQERLSLRNPSMRYIGINRKYPKKAIVLLEETLRTIVSNERRCD